MKLTLPSFFIILFFSLKISAQSPFPPNTSDWKLRAVSASDSYSNTSLQVSLTSGNDFTDKTSLNSYTTRTISVQLPSFSNGGMFVFNPENNIENLVVSTYQSSDGNNWTLLNSNHYLNGRSDDLQKADIPQSASGKWFRISFQNNGSSSIQLKEIGMYQFQNGRNQYFLVLGASITESAGGFMDWKGTMNSRIGASYQPVFFNWSIGGDNTNGLASKIDQFLAQHPNAGYVLVEIGGNDVSATRPMSFSDYKGSYITDMNTQIRGIIQKIINAGKIPVLSRISYRNYPTQTSWNGKYQPSVNGGANQENGSLPYNFVLDKIIKELTPAFWEQNERRGMLDFYQFTINNQQWLVNGDGVHFYGGDAFHIREFWTDFALKYIYTGQKTTPVQYPEFVGDLLNKATQAVIMAENSKSEQDVFTARILAEQLNNKTSRVALIDRLDAVLNGTSTPVVTPSIITQPVSQTVTEGNAVTFTLAATGSTPLAYQWLKNNVIIAGANSNSYSFTSASTDNGAKFKCVVSNSAGSTTSNEVTLSVNPPPSNPPSSAGSGLTGRYYSNSNKDFVVSPALTRTDASIDFDWGNNAPASGVSADNFSVRWTGKIEAIYSGEYTFYITTDDGARVWVNNVLIIDKWWDQGTTEWSGKINLNAGQKYDIKLEYYENAGNATCKLAWSSASQIKQIVPVARLYPEEGTSTPVVTPSIITQPVSQTVTEGNAVTFTLAATGSTPLAYQWLKNNVIIAGANSNSYSFTSASTDNGAKFKCVVSNSAGSTTSNEVTLSVNPPPSNPPSSAGSGLTANYFNQYAGFTSTPVLSRIDNNVNFDWALNAPASSVNPDNFSVRWTGQVLAQFSENYAFFTTSDDGVRLWVNNTLLIDKWVHQGGVEWNGTIALTAGQKYDIKLEYFEGGGNANCKLFWSSNNTPKQIIPTARLYPLLANGTRQAEHTSAKTGISKTENNEILLYPNPATELLNLILPAEDSGKYLLKITNVLGQLVYQSSISSSENRVDIRHLSPGSYFLQIESGQKIVRKRFIKQ